MNRPQCSSPIDEWLQVARKDLDRVRRNLRDGDAQAAGFFLQQSLEKYLKAFLLQRGWRLRKIHELHALLDDAIRHAASLEEFYSLCERVSGYYTGDRYPPLSLMDLTCEDVQKDAEAAKPFILALFQGEAPYL